MSLDTIINRELVRLGRPKLDGIRYEQFILRIGICKVEIYEESRFVCSTSTKQQAIELINSINSGC